MSAASTTHASFAAHLHYLAACVFCRHPIYPSVIGGHYCEACAATWDRDGCLTSVPTPSALASLRVTPEVPRG